MNAKHGAAIAGLVVVIAAIVLVATWPEAGHPDDARDQPDAGSALAPAIEPTAPEEPSPAPTIPPPPPARPTGVAELVAPPSSGTAAPPSAPTPPSEATGGPPTAGPPLSDEEVFDAANALVVALSAQRARIGADLAEAQRRGDQRMIARLTEQRDRLAASLDRAETIVGELDPDRATAPSATPSPATDLPVGP